MAVCLEVLQTVEMPGQSAALALSVDECLLRVAYTALEIMDLA
ncbi:hypothetical protein [Micromonospora rhizosphaerae]|nr:hypothetical protein [Micromonospora rhizosphaerae]